MIHIKLSYVKINTTTYKLFYETYNRYGEFYLTITSVREGAAVGEVHLVRKDAEYGPDLLPGLQEELDPVEEIDWDQIDINRGKEGIN